MEGSMTDVGVQINERQVRQRKEGMDTFYLESEHPDAKTVLSD